MALRKSLIGRVFNSLTVVEHVRTNHSGMWLLRVRCSCGATFDVWASQLTGNRLQDCGHSKKFNKSRSAPARSAHGRPKDVPLYKVWRDMLTRCYDPVCAVYKYYGGRGITVCRRWHFYANFYDDVSPLYVPGNVIDRKDNDKGYWPSNVRFVTKAESLRNRRPFRRKVS